MVEGDGLFAVQDELGRRHRPDRLRDRGKPLGPIQATAGEQRGKASAKVSLKAIAVEFDLVDVSISGRGIVAQSGKLQPDKTRMPRAFGAGDRHAT